MAAGAAQEPAASGQELWRRVATDLLYALNEAMELPADVGELCDEQDARDAVRLLHAELSSLHAASPAARGDKP